MILVTTIFFLYRPESWPIGSEALGCLISFVLLTITLTFLWLKKKKLIDDNQKRNIEFGLYFGLLWTIEISINNFLKPELPYRDIIDNIFWAIITLLILITAIHDAYHSKKYLSGVKSGLWTGFASGAVACLSALLLIVFGMRYILSDPLNIKEWSDKVPVPNASGMAVYFAYQTFAGAIMHLFILGIIFGLITGFIGGLIGWILRKII